MEGVRVEERMEDGRSESGGEGGCFITTTTTIITIIIITLTIITTIITILIKITLIITIIIITLTIIIIIITIIKITLIIIIIITIIIIIIIIITTKLLFIVGSIVGQKTIHTFMALSDPIWSVTNGNDAHEQRTVSSHDDVTTMTSTERLHWRCHHHHRRRRQHHHHHHRRCIALAFNELILLCNMKLRSSIFSRCCC